MEDNIGLYIRSSHGNWLTDEGENHGDDLDAHREGTVLDDNIASLFAQLQRGW